jgi:hypothetical protein
MLRAKRLHHKTPYGKGYPHGYVGDCIPLQVCVECGPTILITRANFDGDLVYCRACGCGVRLHRAEGAVTVSDGDAHGNANELTAKPDGDLIREMVAG